MESGKISHLVAKYLEGATSVSEEKILRDYFISGEVADELMVYQPMFAYFEAEGHAVMSRPFSFSKERRNYSRWFSIAASLLLVAGIAFYLVQQQKTERSDELGTFDDPEKAFAETQKALALLSDHVNKGIESVRYVQAYEDTRDKIFVIDK